jgi:ornithine--oxo-acid transaminase
MAVTLGSRQAIELEDRYGAHNYRPLDVVVSHAQGVWVYDCEGNRYLDCLSAYSAVNQGHCHPRIIRALVEQAGRVTLTSRAFRNDQLGLFCKEACELLGYDRLLPMNSGAEGVETALKAARKWGYKVKGVEPDKAEVIVFDGNFHGRTITIVGFSSEPRYRAGFGPFTPGFKLVPYGDLAAAEAAVTPNTVAFLVEPVQGEAGVIIPPAGFLRGLFRLCDKYDIIFLADEIQSGLGRTGKWLACEHDGVRPDMVVIGKALSGGVYPIAAVLASHEAMGVFGPGDHGSTYGGNPLAAAVAREALRVLADEHLVENSALQGAYLKERLLQVQSKHVEEVRGLGLFIGIQLKPAAGGARRFCEALRDKGLLCKETHDHVIRIAPPLCITRAEVDWAAERLEAVLTTLS